MAELVVPTLFDIGPPTSPWSNSPMFSAVSVHWATPRALYELLDAEFHFTLDPCPLGGGVNDGLKISWGGERVFCNPPYDDVYPWIGKSVESAVSVYLLPVRTDTKWFHEFMPRMSEIRFVKGRVRFGDAKCGAPFPSMLCVIEGAAK